MDSLDLLAHPIRLRIVLAMGGVRTLTTSQLRARIPEASKATVYRHIDLLAAGGILEVAEERRVRGAVERHYRLRQDRARIGPEEVSALTPEDHRRAFATAMTALLAEFTAYLDREGADPVADRVGYRQHSVWLSPAELEELIGGLRAAIAPKLANEPSPERTQYLLSPIHFPMEAPPSEAGT
ncbi:helix-turn-helix domain-containing protein [Streptomyces drozdowiczii]|uniref:Helix-turn-helix domain-containing protein n=1 Tax=Streptomyces drozdowiczii TaxID=202862 RepID=A0ABY6PSY3_9ACTN|nr:helix-turn-helix domain-containing protein [Streptomyces drozdowiczii]MCX0245477.1 helix-turn-helix domain-containing protein [Streptomyces drozdowiczii]UZK54889.1 helix-turn-helix domain-containing protein [Streptomyces drozdowiczii]